MKQAPVRILRIAAGGDGVGRLEDGRTVFIPRTAPGDLVEVAEIRLHARFARARAGRVLEPGPDRVEPACPHYQSDECGGCQLQHLTGTAQAVARRMIVGDALRRIGRLDLPDPPLTAAESAWAYRTRITLAVDARGRAGFHPLGRPEVSFDLGQCPVATAGVNRLWSAVRQQRTRWPDPVRQIGLREDRRGGLHAIFRSPVSPDATAMDLGQAGEEVTVWWQPDEAPARPVGGAGLGAGSAFPATTFEQVNPRMGDMVRSHAVGQLGPLTGRHVWDLYAGIGEATAMLVEAGGSVESVEIDPDAVALARQRGPSTGALRRAGRVEDWVGRLAAPWAVFCNPPRAGLGPEVVRVLAAAAPERIVYVSCDPATLARDLASLGRGGYRVGLVTAFDLFPQTAHVETVASLERT